MTHHQEIITFDELSEKYSTWIIKYCSPTFELPVFLVWYRDNDEAETTKLMTYKSGEISALNSLTNLKSQIKYELDDLNVCENIISWLDNFCELEIIESCTYDIVELQKETAKNNLDIPTIESFVNFINLFDDFVNQDLKYSKLQTYIDNELISETWNYFYNYIFWPRFNDKDKFETWERPQLVIDTKELLEKLNDIVKTFDENIKLTKKTTEQLAEYQRYLEILSSNASIAQTMSFEKEYALKQQKIEIAKKGIIAGYSNEIIQTMTDLTFIEIDKLRNELNDKK